MSCVICEGTFASPFLGGRIWYILKNYKKINFFLAYIAFTKNRKGSPSSPFFFFGPRWSRLLFMNRSTWHFLTLKFFLCIYIENMQKLHKI